MRSIVGIAAFALALILPAPVLAAEVDCAVEHLNPAHGDLTAEDYVVLTDLAMSEIEAIVEDAPRVVANPEQDALKHRFDVALDVCADKFGWSRDRKTIVGAYSMLELAIEAWRGKLTALGVPVQSIEQHYADVPALIELDDPRQKAAAGRTSDPWRRGIVADIRAARINIPKGCDALVASFIAILIWRDQQKADFQR